MKSEMIMTKKEQAIAQQFRAMGLYLIKDVGFFMVLNCELDASTIHNEVMWSRDLRTITDKMITKTEK